MGMFEKDILYGGERLDQWVNEGDSFILWGVEVHDKPIPTDLGEATKTILDVSPLEAPENRLKVGTLASAIAEKAKDAEDSDFPAVVRYEKVPGRFDSDAAVISYVGPFDAETGLTGEKAPDASKKAGAKKSGGKDDIPF